MKFATRAANLYYKLTELEDDIVEYIKNHKAEVADTKIVTLAAEFYTVPNTITRLCRKLGYDGFVALKFELKQELSENVEENHQYLTILRNFDLIVPEREQKVINLFQKAKAVNFYAQDQTKWIAKIGTENFYAIDDKFRLFDYEKEIISQIKRSNSEIFFFISLSGETSTVLSLAELAKSNGHKVVSLTNLSENSLSKMSDVALYCYTEKVHVNHFDLTDKTPLLIILQSLFQSYFESVQN